VVNPDPQYVGDTMEGGSGQRSSAAVQRLETGAVKQPAGTSTTTSDSDRAGETSGSSSNSGPR
jgi:hypothetical protein